jgi:hypothetical protein
MQRQFSRWALSAFLSIVASGASHLVGGMYDVDKGRVQFYDAQ